MATLREIREWFPGFWEVGSGNFVVACSSAERLTFVQSEERARELRHANCCRDCRRYDEPHRGFRVEPAVPAPGTRFSSSFRKMVEQA